VATAEATFGFIDGLYRKNAFRFDNLVDWLRSNTRRA
jgi:hypothetical protein